MLSVYTKGSWYPDLEKGKWLVFNCFPFFCILPLNLKDSQRL